MSAAEDEGVAPGAHGAGYRSPALDRLDGLSRRTAPIRGLAEAGRSRPPEPPPDEQRLTALEARLDRLEQQQLALVANLCQAHEAFRLLARRLRDLDRRVGTPSGDGQPPSTAQTGASHR